MSVFSKLITGKVKIGDMYAKPIIDFLSSLLVRAYGKEYGLTEIYSSGITVVLRVIRF